MVAKQIIFSGIQPTGDMTIGNYLGAVKNFISIQNNYDSLFCIVDLHSLTSNFDSQEIADSIKYNIALCIAAGLNPNKAIIFQQSKVPEHSELAWILSCYTKIGQLNRMTQFKDKIGKNKRVANLGIYLYPILMAADILLYNTDVIPVGEDQKQHIELVRDIALLFNKRTGLNIFKIPNILIDKHAKKIMSLKDCLNKMSKSDPSDFSRINMSDDEKMIAKKIYKAKTDSISGISYDFATRPEVTNLLNIYACLTGSNVLELVNKFKYTNTITFKQDLANIIMAKITPIHKKAIELMKEKGYIEEIIKNGTLRARNIATENIQKIKKSLGII